MNNETFNPYQAPVSAVVQDSAAVEGDDELLFTASPTKLIVLSICTFGFYHMVWFYQNWLYFKRRENLDIRPLARALFALFFVYSLFSKLSALAREKQVDTGVSAGGHAVFFILLQLTGRLPEPLFMISLFSFIPVVVYNGVALSINEARVPGSRSRNRFSGWNWVVALIGAPLQLMIIVGLFLK